MIFEHFQSEIRKRVRDYSIGSVSNVIDVYAHDLVKIVQEDRTRIKNKRDFEQQVILMADKYAAATKEEYAKQLHQFIKLRFLEYKNKEEAASILESMRLRV